MGKFSKRTGVNLHMPESGILSFRYPLAGANEEHARVALSGYSRGPRPLVVWPSTLVASLSHTRIHPVSPSACQAGDVIAFVSLALCRPGCPAAWSPPSPLLVPFLFYLITFAESVLHLPRAFMRHDRSQLWYGRKLAQTGRIFGLASRSTVN